MNFNKITYLVIIGIIVIIGVKIYHEKMELKAEHQKIQQEKRKIQQENQRNIKEFNLFRESIISSIESMLFHKNYQSAILETKKYLITDDEKIKKLHSEAEKGLPTEKLLEELEKYLDRWKDTRTRFEKDWALDFEKKIYQQLVDLNPGNEYFLELQKNYFQQIEDYKEERRVIQERYEQALAEERKKEIIRKQKSLEKVGEKPNPKTWGKGGYDGPVLEYLKKDAHDPYTVRLIRTTDVWSAHGNWVVGVEYEGHFEPLRGIERHKKWFSIAHKKVVSVSPMTAYGIF